MNLLKNKKGQWVHAMARERKSIERQNRKVYSRALTLLGFELNELVNILGVSSNTIKAYLQETEGESYSGLYEFMFKPDIFELFTKDERSILMFIKRIKEKLMDFSEESLRNESISNGKGVEGWIHKKIFKDCEKFDKDNKRIDKEICKLIQDFNNKIRDLKDPKKCPHLSKASIKIGIKKTKIL